MNKYNKKKLYCSNCGRHGHNYKKCSYPKISVGIIGFVKKEDRVKYVMIRRKNSMGFVELIRGKYNLLNKEHIQILVNEMTLYEKEITQTMEFFKLWNILWYSPKKEKINCIHSAKQKKEYDNSEKRFNTLRTSGILKELIEKSNTKWKEPEWGFPKGKRNLKENNINCAKREFEEETNLSKGDYNIFFNFPCKNEIFIGSNNIKYQHIYYLAKINPKVVLGINEKNIHQAGEISAIDYFSLEKCLEMIRPYSKEKKEILLKTDYEIKKYSLDEKSYDFAVKISNFNFQKKRF